MDHSRSLSRRTLSRDYVLAAFAGGASQPVRKSGTAPVTIVQIVDTSLAQQDVDADFVLGARAHYEVLAVLVEQVDVVAGDARFKARAHPARERLVSQALGPAHLPRSRKSRRTRLTPADAAAAAPLGTCLARTLETLNHSLDVEPRALIEGYLRLGANVLGPLACPAMVRAMANPARFTVAPWS